MGSSNPLAWILPFSAGGGGGPDNRDCWSFETNGFENPGEVWPPIDPDRMNRSFVRNVEPGDNFVGDVAAFRRRQEADMKRWEERPVGEALREQERNRATVVDVYGRDVVEDDDVSEEYESEYEEGMDGEEGWTSRDGSRLKDFGVDEDAEGYANHPEDEQVDAGEEDEEDNIPLAELIRRRKKHVSLQS